MATFTAIKNKKQTAGVLGGVLKYIRQEKKTCAGGLRFVTGHNCVPQSVYTEMMTTKRRFKKTDGRQFYHFVQSFAETDALTPQEANAISLELTQREFPGFEVVVATHLDTNYIHNHLVVNSVSCETGRKLHQSADDLLRHRQANDEICAAHGLSILEQLEKRSKKKRMKPGEYQAGLREDSWKMDLIHAINGSLEKAVELGMIVRNPCKGVTFPKDDTEDMRVLSQEEQQRFIGQLEGEYYRPMFLMYLYSGLRMGEGIPLTWEDMDLEKRTIRVNKKAIVCHDYASHSAPQVVQDFCKTKSSKRKVVITAGLVGVLQEHKAEMMKRVEQSGEEWSESGLVFPNTRGNMVHNRNLQNSLYRIFAKAGIEGATMHTLRHTYATRCFEAGVDIKAISEQLGHANVKTTYNIYVHLLEDTKEKEIDKLAGIDKLLA